MGPPPSSPAVAVGSLSSPDIPSTAANKLQNMSGNNIGGVADEKLVDVDVDQLIDRLLEGKSLCFFRWLVLNPLPF